MARNEFTFQSLSLGGAFGAAVIAGAASVVLLLVGIVMNFSGLTYAAVATLAFLLPLSVGLMRGTGFDPFEPINLVALAILYGTTLRAFWLLTTDATTQVEFIMMGTTMEAVSENAPLMLASILCLVLGYAVTPYRFHLERLGVVRNYALSRSRLGFALLFVVAVSLIGIPWMISNYGITFEGGLLSASLKRVATYVNDSGETVYGAGYQRYMASATQYGFVLLTAVVLAGIVKLRPPVMVVLGLMAILMAIPPYLTSSRSSLVLPGLQLTILAFYYRRLTVKAILTLGVSIVFLLAFLGQLREMNQSGIQRDLSAIDRVIGAGNSLDLVRTSAIMDRVPEVVGYQNGWTYAALIAVPVPRAVWPDKPLIGLGGFVKEKIFGQRVRMGGWPSGMIAEGWINFGVWGLFLPLFVFGALLRFIYESVRPLLGTSFPITLLYSVSAFRLGFNTVGLNFSHGVADTMVHFIPMLIMLILARQPRRKSVYRPVAAHPAG